jgi:hypothetical protein
MRHNDVICKYIGKWVIKMDDQGEKIVFLARALLNTSAEEPRAARKAAHIPMTFKALCFTTILAAGGGGLITSLMHEKERPLNRYERYEMQALLFYTARLKGTQEESLRHIIEQKIGIARFDDMTAGDFPTARCYLQEMAQ